MTGQLTMGLTEEHKKRAVLERMGENELRAYLLERARKYARGIWQGRAKRVGPEEATVCADDVRHYVEKVLEPPDWVSRNCLGAVFRTGEWEAVGWTTSEWPGSHANPLRTWRYVGEA